MGVEGGEGGGGRWLGAVAVAVGLGGGAMRLLAIRHNLAERPVQTKFRGGRRLRRRGCRSRAAAGAAREQLGEGRGSHQARFGSSVTYIRSRRARHELSDEFSRWF